MKFVIALPTYNGIYYGLEKTLQSIKSQTLQPNDIYIIDSSSNDGTVEVCRQYDCSIDIISKNEFNHGLTRQKAVDKYKHYDFIVFLTQDAKLESSNTLETLLSSFNNENVSIVYGRQLTDKNSSLIEKVSRKFSYPDTSCIKNKESIKDLGLHTPFCSDSFAAYKIADIQALGGFPKTNFGEDMLFGAKVILNNKSIYYNAEAKVWHSHSYSLYDEYNRGKAIGHMHKENSWLLDSFGKAEDRGLKLLKSVPVYLKPLLLLQALPKYIGYKIGKYTKY